MAEKRGEFAAQFDATHSVQRAVRMGSVSRTIAPATMRPYLIEAVERGIRVTHERESTTERLLADGHRTAAPTDLHTTAGS